MPLDAPTILFEDDWCFAVDKPSGLAVHRGWSRDAVTLVDQLKAGSGGQATHPVGRLDRGTSGVVLFAREGCFIDRLTEAVHGDGGRRRYVALVRGVPPDEGFIDHPLPRREGGPRVPARTSYRRVESQPTEPRTTSLVEASLETGRLHQVRRHLKHINHPVIGDANYGRPDLNRALCTAYGLCRLALHAVEVGFVHPITGEPVSITAPLPADLAEPLARMGFHY